MKIKKTDSNYHFLKFLSTLISGGSVNHTWEYVDFFFLNINVKMMLENPKVKNLKWL